jgi:xylan 1,4-beta-xylosidase
MKYTFIFCAAIVAVFAAGLFQAQAATYNLTVLADKQVRPWDHFIERGVATDHMAGAIMTAYGRGWGTTLAAGHREAGFQYFRGHAILGDEIGLVQAASTTTLTLNWTKFDSVYNMGIHGGIRPCLEISCTPPALASGTQMVTVSYQANKSPPTKYGWGQWMNLMDSITRHCEAKWGVDEVHKWYFEVWNEPDWWYINFSPDYVTLYDYTVTGLRRPDSLIKVGGPACEGNNAFGGGNTFPALLNHCHTGTNAATGKVGAPLDFLAYHWYGGGNGTDANGDIAMYQKSIWTNINSGYSWYKGLVICDEQSCTAFNQQLLQAGTWLAFAAKTLAANGPQYPPPYMLDHWTISDLYEESGASVGGATGPGGGMALYPRGNTAYPNSWDIGKPPINAYNLLKRLGSMEDSSSGGGAANADGVNLIATSDSSNNSIQVLVYSFFKNASTSTSTTDNITLTINNIPWAPGSVRVEQFLLDATHSNTSYAWTQAGSPGSPSNAQWDQMKAASVLQHYDSVTTQTLTAKTFTKTFPLNYWGMTLLTLSNPNVSTKQPPPPPARAAKVEPRETLRADIHNGKLMLTSPEPSLYKVGLYTMSGREVFQCNYPAGAEGIALQKIPSGLYIIQCSSPKYSLVKQIAVRL